MTYYRFTNSDNVLSAWGHAMFAADETMVSGYGSNEYVYSGLNGVDITALYPAIAREWGKSADYGLLPDGYEDMDPMTACKMFNPSDIVMSAEAWDSAELLTWFCEHIAIPQDIKAVITDDGAILFDAALAVLSDQRQAAEKHYLAETRRKKGT